MTRMCSAQIAKSRFPTFTDGLYLWLGSYVSEDAHSRGVHDAAREFGDKARD